MVKSLEAVVVLRVFVKKLVALPSGAAVIAIVTPFAGIADVILTFRSKVGPTAGACVLPDAGVVVTARVDSAVFLPPPQPDKKRINATTRMAGIPLDANRCFI